MVAKRRATRSAALHHVAGVIAPVGLGGAIGGVWLIPLGGSWQFLMATSALAAASPLLFLLNFGTQPAAKRAA
jgi:glucose dehydrogenase